MSHQEDKEGAQLALWVILLIALAVTLLISIVVGGITAISWATAGPRDQLRADFSVSCSKQFAAAQFPPECVAFAKGGK